MFDDQVPSKLGKRLIIVDKILMYVLFLFRVFGHGRLENWVKKLLLGEGSGLLAGLTRGKNQLQFGSNYNWQLFDVFRLFCSRVGSKLTKCMENLGKKVFNFQNELQDIVFDTYVGLYWRVSNIGADAVIFLDIINIFQSYT